VAVFQCPITSNQRALTEAANRILEADAKKKRAAKARKQRAIANWHKQKHRATKHRIGLMNRWQRPW
jgi:hypothetical protein